MFVSFTGRIRFAAIAGAALLIGLVLFSSEVGTVKAAAIVVTRFDDPTPDGCNSGVDCSLREAIILANGNGTADTINLVAGTYTLDEYGPGENAALTGDLDIVDDVVGPDLTITGAGRDLTIIDASGLGDRVFEIRSSPNPNPPADAQISDLEITGGSASGSNGTDGADGAPGAPGAPGVGGVPDTPGDPGLPGDSGQAGALGGVGGGAEGGGILNAGILTLTNVDVVNNSATGGTGGLGKNGGFAGGGGIRNGAGGALVMNNVLLSGNVAQGGNGGRGYHGGPGGEGGAGGLGGEGTAGNSGQVGGEGGMGGTGADGSTGGNGGYAYGGGIYSNANGTLLITDSTIVNNLAQGGDGGLGGNGGDGGLGGVAGEGGSATGDEVTDTGGNGGVGGIGGNGGSGGQAGIGGDGRGAGIAYLGGPLTITNTTLSDNGAFAGIGGLGGIGGNGGLGGTGGNGGMNNGLGNDGDGGDGGQGGDGSTGGDGSNSGASALGGGLYASSGDLYTLTGSAINGNIVTSSSPTGPGPGGIEGNGGVGGTGNTGGSGGGSGNPGIPGSPGSSDSIARGGGIYDASGGSPRSITNTTISGNSVTGNSTDEWAQGGGIYTGMSITMNNVTIFDNNVTTPGTIDYGGGFSSGGGVTITLYNTIIIGNTAGSNDDCNSGGATIVRNSYNLLGSTCNPTGTDINYTSLGITASDVFSSLTPTTAEGGSTAYHPLAFSSPAINAGNPATPGGGGAACSSTDQRGTTIRPVGAICDIGAIEDSDGGAVKWYVSTTGNNANDCLSSAQACRYTLADDGNGPGALSLARPGDTIEILAGAYQEQVTVSKNHITLLGDTGGGTAIICNTSMPVLAPSSGVVGLVLEDLIIAGECP